MYVKRCATYIACVEMSACERIEIQFRNFMIGRYNDDDSRCVVFISYFNTHVTFSFCDACLSFSSDMAINILTVSVFVCVRFFGQHAT